MRVKNVCVFLLLSVFILPCFAQRSIDSLKVIAHQAKNINQKKYLNTLLELSWLYRLSSPDSSIRYAEQVLVASRKYKFTETEADALYQLAVASAAQADYNKALKFNEESLSLRKRLANPEKIADAEMNRGVIYDAVGNYPEAIKYYSQAYKTYKKLDKKDKLILLDINLGILFKAQGKYQQVIKYYKSAHELAKQQSMYFEQLVCKANLGSVYLFTHQYDSAMYYSVLAEQGFTQIKNYQSLPVVQGNIGLAYVGLQKPQLAKKHFEIALQGHKKYGNLKEQAFVNIELAKLFRQENKPDEAITVLKTALKIAQEIGAIQQQMEAHLHLSEIYLLSNNFKDAYNYQKAYTELKDSIYRRESAQAIENFSVQYESEKKEQQINVQNLELERRRLYLIILIFLLVLVSVGAYLIYLQRKQREERLLQEAKQKIQEERIRISRELHDNIGSQLTFIHTAMNGLGNNNSEREKIEQVRQLTSDTIKELRKTVWLINKPSVSVAEFSVKLIDLFRNLSQIKVNQEGNESLQLNTIIATQLFRVVQEAVNNALKYSEAQNITISFIAGSRELSVKINDDGKGFDVVAGHAGQGLANMEYRINTLNGKFTITSKKGTGTCLSIWLPVETSNK